MGQLIKLVRHPYTPEQYVNVDHIHSLRAATHDVEVEDKTKKVEGATIHMAFGTQNRRHELMVLETPAQFIKRYRHLLLENCQKCAENEPCTGAESARSAQ